MCGRARQRATAGRRGASPSLQQKVQVKKNRRRDSRDMPPPPVLKKSGLGGGGGPIGQFSGKGIKHIRVGNTIIQSGDHPIIRAPFPFLEGARGRPAPVVSVI